MSRIGIEFSPAPKPDGFYAKPTTSKRPPIVRAPPTAPLSGQDGHAAPVAPKPERKPLDMAPSLGELNAPDTAGLINMSRSKMMLSLSRIENALSRRLADETDSRVKAELHLGLHTITENLRRLSLAQSGSDALIGK